MESVRTAAFAVQSFNELHIPATSVARGNDARGLPWLALDTEIGPEAIDVRGICVSCFDRGQERSIWSRLTEVPLPADDAVILWLPTSVGRGLADYGQNTQEWWEAQLVRYNSPSSSTNTDSSRYYRQPRNDGLTFFELPSAFSVRNPLRLSNPWLPAGVGNSRELSRANRIRALEPVDPRKTPCSGSPRTRVSSQPDQSGSSEGVLPEEVQPLSSLSS